MWRSFSPKGYFPSYYQVQLEALYYWPTIFKDSYVFIRKRLACQKNYGWMKRETMPLLPILVEAPFMQWGLEFIGPINPNSSQEHSSIMITTDYFTKWKEERAHKEVDINKLISFIEENILS